MLPPRFYPILDTAVLAACGLDTVEAARVLVGEGVQILQYRHKAFFSRSHFAQVRDIARLCHQAGILFVLNDRSDLARLFSVGVHLGQSDLPPVEARAILGMNLPMGYSTHNETQLAEANGSPADYLALGPVFGTTSKERPDPTLGLEEFRRLAAGSVKPLVAIGGIDLQNASRVFQAGAASVAVISDLLEPDKSLEGLRKKVRDWLTLPDKFPAFFYHPQDGP